MHTSKTNAGNKAAHQFTNDENDQVSSNLNERRMITATM